jgi:hypothetical protein
MNSFKIINESINEYGHEGNVKEISKLGKIPIIDFKTNNIIKIDAKDIINVVNNALLTLETKHSYLNTFIKAFKIMYIPIYPCEDITNTMGVDPANNLWINMTFVYNQCNMDENIILGILLHELFHVFLDHIVRFEKMFPKHIQKQMEASGILDKVRTKANVSMDYEVNGSLVADNFVSKNFWNEIGGCYKKEYVGKTWEEIYNEFGDQEYKDYVEKNGKSISEDEMKILEAIEKAAKILKDPNATEADKAKANRELQKTLDKILNRDKNEDDIQDVLEKFKKTKFGKIGEIGDKLQDVIDDLYKDPSKMSESEFEDLMKHISDMADEMIKNSDTISNTFKKSEETTREDIDNMLNTMKDSMSQMRNKKLSKDEKKDLFDKIKDSIEDVSLSDYWKDDANKKRKERDEQKAKEKNKKMKLNHPIRKLINVFKNLMELGVSPYDLVCKKSYDLMENIVNILDKLTEIELSKITKNDVKDLKTYLSKLKDSLFTDLKALLDNKTILHKTEDDLHRVLDGVFEFVERTFFVHLISSITDDEKISVIKNAVQQLRIIGKILKTQKSWRASDEFKEGYREKRDELLTLFNKDKKATLETLYNMGILTNENIMSLDSRSKKLFDELVAEGKINKKKRI